MSVENLAYTNDEPHSEMSTNGDDMDFVEFQCQGTQTDKDNTKGTQRRTQSAGVSTQRTTSSVDRSRARPTYPVPSKVILMDATEGGGTQFGFSYNKLCHVLGNRQGRFIEALRSTRAFVNETVQSLLCLHMELERSIRPSTLRAIDKIAQLVANINDLIADSTLNIPPNEGDLLRTVNFDLVVIRRMLVQLNEDLKESQREGDADNMYAGKISDKLDEQSLKDQIARNAENLEHLVRWIDRKTERRWWLKDAINFLQLFVRLALFISASISVAYMEYRSAPAVTLAITIIQGVVDLLEQFFIKNVNPREIKLSVIRSMNAPPLRKASDTSQLSF